jgi:hypothetical protein
MRGRRKLLTSFPPRLPRPMASFRPIPIGLL